MTLLCQCDPVYADGRQVVGARSWGMGKAMVARSDRFAVFNNVAGIAASSEPALFSSYHSHFGLEGLGTSALGMIVPINPDLSLGSGITHFGDKYLNEITAGFGVAHRVDDFKIGLKVNYLQLAANTGSFSTSRKAVTVELGGIWTIHPKLNLGAQVYNFTQTRLRGHHLQTIPTVLKTGLAYMPANTIALVTDLVIDSDYPSSLRYGIQVEPVKSLFLRTGIATHPRTHHFGIGLTGPKFSLDYAIDTHSLLGGSHHLSLSYSFSGTGKAGNEMKNP